jgi:type VI secretion system protein VasJ
MLGAIGMNSAWQWSAYGKHPVARDYFRLGKDFALSKGFSDWVEKGYPLVTAKKEIGPGLSSWRFWARGPGKDGLACGLVRDSADRVGRPYPLLIMGMGPLKGWEDHWDLLPFACERTWEQVEYLSALIVTDFKKLEAEIQNIRPPSPEWSEYGSRREDFRNELVSPSANGASGMPHDPGQASKLLEKTELFIGLDGGPLHDQFARIGFWHFFVRTRLTAIPNVIFMGGTFEKACLALYRRPLVASDFLELWTLPSVKDPQQIFRLQ